MIILVDFDGTIIPQLPYNGICDIDTGAERVLKRLVSSGHLLVLWTCRNESKENPYNYVNGIYRGKGDTCLDEAVRWFRERNIPLYGINEVPGEKCKVGCSRKPLGDLLIDDTALGTPLTYGEVNYTSIDTGKLIKGYKTFCVDWGAMEALLTSMKVI